MQKLKVWIEEHASGSIRPVEMAAEAPIAALVPALVAELQLPQTDRNGKKLVYMLRYALNGHVLPRNTTLQASGVGSGTRLALDSYAIDVPLRPNDYKDSSFHSAMTVTDANALPAVMPRNTSAHMHIVTNGQNKQTRRAFLLIGGTLLLGAASVASGYGAYRLLTNGESGMQATTTPNSMPKIAKPLLSFTHHQQIVRTVSWSPDGKLLASGADDARLLIWGTDGTVHRSITHPASVRAIAWAPDGQRLVTGANNQVLFLNALTGSELHRSTHHHTAPVTSLAWSQHNQHQVVSGALDMHALVWNTTKYQVQTMFTRHTTPIEAVSWAADGQSVASSSSGGLVRVWNAANGQEVHGFYLDAQLPMRTLAFAPSGMQLAVGGDDGIVRFRDGLTCQSQKPSDFGDQCLDMPQHLQVANSSIRSLAWSPDARFIAIGSDDGTLSLWYPTQNQKPLFTLAQQSIPVHSITWSPNGTQFATTLGNTVTIWGLS